MVIDPEFGVKTKFLKSSLRGWVNWLLRQLLRSRMSGPVSDFEHQVSNTYRWSDLGRGMKLNCVVALTNRLRTHGICKLLTRKDSLPQRLTVHLDGQVSCRYQVRNFQTKLRLRLLSECFGLPQVVTDNQRNLKRFVRWERLRVMRRQRGNRIRGATFANGI